MTSIDQLTTILRQQLIRQTGIESNLVRDATTEYGAFLDTNSSLSIFTSLLPSQVALLFELKTRDSHDNVSMTNQNDSISFFRAYQLRIILYGNDSDNIANKLVARFRTEKVRNELLAQGIYVESLSEPERITEFKNNVVWIRNDISINIACEINISQESVDQSMTGFDDMCIVRDEDDILPENPAL